MKKESNKLSQYKNNNEDAGFTSRHEEVFPAEPDTSKQPPIEQIRHKWQSKMASHPTYGPVLVTNITPHLEATVEILSNDYRETLFKKNVPMNELFYNFTFFNKLCFAFKSFFVVMSKRTFVDHNYEKLDNHGRG